MGMGFGEIHQWGKNGAGNGIRTRDPQLGRLMLYQLSYSRKKNKKTMVGTGGFEPP
jgi:hypothetical protein